MENIIQEGSSLAWSISVWTINAMKNLHIQNLTPQIIMYCLPTLPLERSAKFSAAPVKIFLCNEL